MANLDQLKQKYSGVISTIQGFSDLGATVDQVGLDGERLLLKARVPSKVIANRVWDKIKQADPPSLTCTMKLQPSVRIRSLTP